MNINKIKSTLEKHRNQIGVDRDNLRALAIDLGELEETCERAYDSLQDAIDALSELA